MGLLLEVEKAVQGQITEKELQSLIASFNNWAKNREAISVERYLKDATGRKRAKKSKLQGIKWLLRNQQNGNDNLNLQALDVLFKTAIKRWKKEVYFEPVKVKSSKRKRKTGRIKQRRKEYKQYLKTDWWKARRYSKVISIGMCEVCSSDKHLLVHHLTYKNIGHEPDKDLAVLCKYCHTRLHKEYGRGASFGIEVIEKERKKQGNL